MGISDEDIAKVRDSSDLVAVVSQYSPLRRVGRRHQGLCPFHSEKTPSFSVNAEQGVYYCFGCGVKGDVITFLREKEQLDFVEAVELLANKAGIELTYDDANRGRDRRRRTELQELVQRGVDWYHQRLLTDPTAGPARSYLRSRGYDGEVVKEYQIGWAPPGWDNLVEHLDIPAADLTDSGLGFINRRGRPQDMFRARILFPIFDQNSNAVGFGGRKLPDGEGPKYINSSESAVYAKSGVLYGLNWAKAAIVEEDRVVVCEGYTDVIGFRLAGVQTAVATCGTALTDQHVRLLKRFANRVILAFDADSAGKNAAARFYEWEKEFDLEVAVAGLPTGVDPGDMAQDDPAGLREAVDDAQPFLRFQIDRVLNQHDLSSAESRARAAEAAIALVREHPDPLVRDQYAMLIHSRCRLDVELIRARLAAKDSGGPNSGPSQFQLDSQSRAEQEALRLMIHTPADIEKLISVDLFRSPRSQVAYEKLSTSESIHTVIGSLDADLAELVYRLAAEASTAQPIEVAARLWDTFIDDQMAAILSQPALTKELSLEHTWLRHRREEVRDPATQEGAIQDLLAWIRDRGADSEGPHDT